MGSLFERGHRVVHLKCPSKLYNTRGKQLLYMTKKFYLNAFNLFVRYLILDRR